MYSITGCQSVLLFGNILLCILQDTVSNSLEGTWKDEAQYPLTLSSCHVDRGWNEPSNSLGGSSHAVEWIFMNECARIRRSKALECAPCFHPYTYIYDSDSQLKILSGARNEAAGQGNFFKLVALL